MARPLPRIEVLQELREVNEALVELLASLAPADWSRPTVHRDRDVKDLAAHLLDGSLKRVAALRDGWRGVPFEGSTYEDLVAFIQRMNREWMTAARRLSPRMLVDMTREADEEMLLLFRALDPDAPALGVAWAGEQTSPAWFDVAREYTEKWHHQQQIRDAVGRPDLGSRRHLGPVLATFLRGLPHAYRATPAPDDTAVQISITGDASTAACLVREDGRWALHAKTVGDPACEVVMDGDTAWRLWTKSLPASDAPSRIAVHGDPDLAAPTLAMVCIMA